MAASKNAMRNDRSFIYYKDRCEKLEKQCEYLEAENKRLKEINDSMQTGLESLFDEFDKKNNDLRKSLADIGRLRLKCTTEFEESRKRLQDSITAIEKRMSDLNIM